nr:unnamed protein product [Spirometra erinaceieuropaei]
MYALEPTRPCANTQESESLTKKRKLYSDPIDPRTVPSPSPQDIILVAAGERTGPFPHPHPNPPTHPAQRSNALHSSGPSPLLASELYEPGQNIREWLQDLSLLLVSVPPHEHVCYLLRFLSPPARRLAFNAGLTHTSDFQRASEVVLQLFASPDASAIANQRFTTLRQRPGQSVDDFAHNLRRLAAAAFAHLPESDRDRFILHQFITGLRDRTASGVLLLHPPASLSSAIQQYGLPPYQFDFWTTTPDAPIAQRLDPKLGDVDITSQNLDLIFDAVVAAATLEPSEFDANLPPAETVGAENRNRLYDTLDSLGGAAWFSTLDLKSGYWQVEIDPKDRQKTASIVPQGLFEFQTLLFGLCNAAATFQRLMYQMLRHLVPHKCLVYLNDIIVFGPDVEQHNRNLREVLEALRAADLTLNSAKCTFLRPEVQFLGHKISPGRIAALPDRLQQIRIWPTPANQTQLRCFLGLASYYRRCMRNFAHIARQIHKLTEKGRDFRWPPECEEAFTSLRAALVSAPLLALPNVYPDAPPFILDRDASGFAIGAVLSQTDAQGVEHPICFAINTLTKSQRNYCTFCRELLAIITFIRQFKHLLIGRRFILRTDHKALQWLQSIKDPMDQLARWQ